MSEKQMCQDELIEGYQRFRAGAYRHQKKLYEELGTQGQSPRVMIIACCDSRADPSDIFDTAPGDVFMVRNVANLVPAHDEASGFDDTSAALEFGVTGLKVDAIVVMGHESCGGVKASLSGAGRSADGGYVGKWVALMNRAHDRVCERHDAPQDRQAALEYESIRESLSNLMTYDFIADAVKDGSLSLTGAYFSIIRGALELMDENGEFHEAASAKQ